MRPMRDPIDVRSVSVPRDELRFSPVSRLGKGSLGVYQQIIQRECGWRDNPGQCENGAAGDALVTLYYTHIHTHSERQGI